jgi:hypothetical protein
MPISDNHCDTRVHDRDDDPFDCRDSRLWPGLILPAAFGGCQIKERRQAGGGPKRRQYSPSLALLHGEVDPIEILMESLFNFLVPSRILPSL